MQGSVVAARQNIIDRTNIWSGGYELIDSRCIIVFDNNFPVEIEEIFNVNFRFLLRIYFERDDSGEHKIQINVDENNNTIEYKCYNFDNSLGTGTSKPIEVGSVGEKKIFFLFWIYAIGGKNGMARKLEYSLWKET